MPLTLTQQKRLDINRETCRLLVHLREMRRHLDGLMGLDDLMDIHVGSLAKLMKSIRQKVESLALKKADLYGPIRDHVLTSLEALLCCIALDGDDPSKVIQLLGRFKDVIFNEDMNEWWSFRDAQDPQDSRSVILDPSEVRRILQILNREAVDDSVAALFDAALQCWQTESHQASEGDETLSQPEELEVKEIVRTSIYSQCWEQVGGDLMIALMLLFEKKQSKGSEFSLEIIRLKAAYDRLEGEEQDALLALFQSGNTSPASNYVLRELRRWLGLSKR